MDFDVTLTLKGENAIKLFKLFCASRDFRDKLSYEDILFFIKIFENEKKIKDIFG